MDFYKGYQLQRSTLTGRCTILKSGRYVNRLDSVSSAIYYIDTELSQPKENIEIGDKVVAVSEKATFAKDMYYKGSFQGYTKTGRVRVKGMDGIRCYNPCNVETV